MLIPYPLSLIVFESILIHHIIRRCKDILLSGPKFQLGNGLNINYTEHTNTDCHLG